MPHERYATSAPRPLMPTLSTGNKAAQRPPLTPRVAGAISQSSSPLVRRGTAPPETNSNTTFNGSSKDHASTPVKAFVAANITPRSSARKAKIDSSNTPQGTPTGTPSNSRPTTADSENNTPTVDRRKAAGSEVSNSGLSRSPDRPRSLVNGGRTHKATLSSPDIASPDSRPASNSSATGNESPRFFNANEARPSPSARPPISTTKSSSFFYADGSRESSGVAPLPPNTAASAPPSATGDGRAGRFFYANDVQDNVNSPPLNGAFPSSSGARASPRVPMAHSVVGARPPSPPKLAQRWAQPQHGNIKGPVLASPPVGSPVPHSIPLGHTPPTAVRAGNSQRQVSHGRSASAGSMDSSTPSLVNRASKNLTRTDSVSTTASSAFISHPGTEILDDKGTPSDKSFASPVPILSPPVPLSQLISPSSPQATSPGPIPKSPSKSGGMLAQMNALAEQARRERKVQDLEISNSSLLAINRTLEREMRKQTAELRRFRRLSRSGRLSLGGGDLSMGLPPRKKRRDPTLGSVDEENQSDSDLDLLSSSDDQFSEEEEEDEEDLEGGSEPMTEDAKARSARQRARDEKRLHVDLRKHQQLLADSTRMNQSLKRCLGRTEAMIEEGRKALAFAVRVSDVEIGGRVLTHHDDEDEAIPLPSRPAVEDVHTDGGERAERDSGVDFSSDLDVPKS